MVINNQQNKKKRRMKMGKKTTKEFVKEAKHVHGNKYDYSKVKYVNANTKVEFVCPKHGVFAQTPSSHLRGQGCPMCGGKKKLTTLEFARKAKEVHGNKYDYSKVRYTNAKSKVKIICPEHGVFEQLPSNHLSGCGCPRHKKEQPK